MITEKQFEAQVKDLAKICHVQKYYHPFLSKWSEKGFPDLTIIKVPRLIFAELKSEKGIVSEAQQEWLNLLSQCTQIEVYLWRPDNLETEILKVLKGDK